ncbi:anti-phage ZorAB system protein ZorA [Hoeflea olei]|uniref:HAMP domain-containing protein n=1 Tax=Hoeflea olei TaxID=1480615 RepID=A0A1C1YUE8_9HYPH|nr:anti-phage ZorAB system protein ZorA [Hoeflea olei]OCW57065.1 hypothetical protein AWJ14_07900 [Hoeflea olei]
MGFLVNWSVRTIVFWAILLAIFFFSQGLVPYHDLSKIGSTVAASYRTGAVEGLSERTFVFAFAAAIAVVGLGLLVAFLVNTLLIVVTLRSARQRVERIMKPATSPGERRRLFAQGFDGASDVLQRWPVIGHAFLEFCETLVNTDEDEIRNTVRPQSFFHSGVAREAMPGFKMMNAIPGYFVGIGLLLTFIGLVLALAKAGQATAASDADQMQGAMTDLLNIATFKFSTSIAGLGASIVLSFVFRIYSIMMEGAFERFCSALEQGLLYASPQKITDEMNTTMKEQLVQLKTITQGDFFARMGTEIAPRMQEAIASAMTPVSDHIREAVSDLKSNSQSGMSDMLQEFGRAVQGGAGVEMQALTSTLGQMEKTLSAMQNDLRGSGEDFSRRMVEAAEQLKQFVVDAGSSFGQSSSESREALAGVAATLRETLERANADMAAGLGAAAGSASGKLEEAMGVVMGKLEAQVGGLTDHLDSMRAAMDAQSRASDQRQASQNALIERTSEAAALAQSRMQEGVAGAIEDIGAMLNQAVSRTVAQIAERFDALGAQMQGVEQALGHQRLALEGTASEARKTADAFSATAQDVRLAMAPLGEVGDRFSAASESMSGNLERTADTVRGMQDEIAALAASLQEANGRAREFWEGFRAKFDQVDTALGEAVATLARATGDQSQLLEKQVASVDSGLADAVSKLSPLLSDLRTAAEDIATGVEKARVRFEGEG